MPTNLLFSFPFECEMFISTKEEILSRPLADVTHLDSQLLNTATTMDKEFDMKLSVKRKSTDTLMINCHFVAVTCIGRKPTHFLITFGAPANSFTVTEHSSNPDIANMTQSHMPTTQQSQQTSVPKPNAEPRGSLQGSIRRGMISFIDLSI